MKSLLCFRNVGNVISDEQKTIIKKISKTAREQNLIFKTKPSKK